jgi:hypothetical protein
MAAVRRNKALAERADIVSAAVSRLIVVRSLSGRSRAQNERRSRRHFDFRQHVSPPVGLLIQHLPKQQEGDGFVPGLRICKLAV